MRVVIIGILVSILFILATFSTTVIKKETEQQQINNNALAVLEKYDLPDILMEVSGITYLGNGSFACVQDELGTIFIYNIHNATITEKIDFTDKGDFEGIAVVGDDAYIIRSDGHIFEVQQFRSNQPVINSYSTSLTSDHNIEGLCYDKSNHRLLIAIKDEEPGNKNYKGIYGFDLHTKSLNHDPIFKLNFNDRIFDRLRNLNTHKVIRPSEINIHPLTGNIYILDAEDPKLLILNPKAVPVELHILEKSYFKKPEGLTFDQDGTMFISNEGKFGKANILKIKHN